MQRKDPFNHRVLPDRTADEYQICLARDERGSDETPLTQYRSLAMVRTGVTMTWVPITFTDNIHCVIFLGVGQNPSRTKPPRTKPLWDETPLGQNPLRTEPPSFMKQYYTSLCYVTFVLNMDTFIVIVFSLVQIVITARPVSKSPSLWHGLWRFQCKCGYRVPLLPF